MLVWGFPISFGGRFRLAKLIVFLEHYQGIFNDKRLPSIGAVATGSMYMLMPPLQMYLSSRPLLRPYTMWVGLLSTCAGLLGAAFASTVPSLILTQGCLCGIGGTMLYCPATAYMFEWWRLRRGLSSGIMFAGTGAGGLVMPIICAELLTRFGRRTTLISIVSAKTG